MGEVEPPDCSWHHRLIAATCDFYEDCVYIEVGTEVGACINYVQAFCGEVHGVDVVNFSEHMDESINFWHMSSEEFFEQYAGTRPDVVFIDGDHAYEAVLQDYLRAEEMLAPGGVIFLHDTWPLSENDTSLDACGGVYQLREDLEQEPDAETFTWTQFPGLTLVRIEDQPIQHATLP